MSVTEPIEAMNSNQKAPYTIDIKQCINMLKTTHKYEASVDIFSSEISISMKLPSIHQYAKDIFKTFKLKNWKITFYFYILRPFSP